jgi:redox-sensing transcriptional repressor
MSARPDKVLNSPAVRRLPSYLHWLLRMQSIGKRTVSTTELADCMKLGWIVVRKDIALTGLAGRPRVGYDVDRLVEAIRTFLGWETPHPAVLFGAGALGEAVLGFAESGTSGIRIDAVFDEDPARVGTSLRGRTVLPLSDLSAAFRRDPPEIAVLCVPAETAQDLADRVVRLGVRAIWNFAATALEVPEGVVVQREDLAGGFATLSAKLLDSRPARRRKTRRTSRS